MEAAAVTVRCCLLYSQDRSSGRWTKLKKQIGNHTANLPVSLDICFRIYFYGEDRYKKEDLKTVKI